MNIEFKEEQEFPQWLRWGILIATGLFPVYILYKQLILGEPIGGNKPMSDITLMILSITLFAILLLFWSIKLKTEINQDGIKMNFFPLVKKQVRWKDIKSVAIVDYGFVGGWGIRFWTAYGTVYNTKGTKGIAIELVNGKKFLIGTQKETELRQTLEKLNK